jgi:hypothetical protein
VSTLSAQGDDTRRDEAGAQNELGALLQKQRPEKAHEMVAAVLQKEIPTSDKIKEIRRIDFMAEMEERGETVAQPLARPIAAIRAVIKTPHARASMLEYLLRQHGKLRAFARRSHVLDVGVVPPRARLNPDVQKPFREQLQPLASELLELCDKALASGWLVLTRGDYNLVVLLKRLCFEVSSLNFRVLDYRDRDLVDTMRSMETYFLVLHYRQDYPERTTRALQTALASAPGGASQSDRERVSLMVATLLSPGLALPSLHDFVIGLNIVRVKRALKLEDLVFTELGEILNTRDFACPPSVQMSIGDHVLSLQKQVSALNKQRNEVERLKRVLAVDASGNPDFSPLASLYDGVQAATESARQTFAIDQNNLMALAPRLLATFDATFTPLLSGRMRLADGPTVGLFAPDLFGTELQRLRQTAANLARLGFKLHVLTRARMITLKNTGKGGVVAEAETLHEIDEGVRIMMEIASRVEGVLDSPLRRGDQTVTDPMSPLILPEREFSLPSKEQRIVARDSLKGKPVYEALRFLVAVCYAAGAFFLDRPILLTLERAGKITEKLESTKRELERLADPQMPAAEKQ